MSDLQSTLAALRAIESIKRPHGDLEGDAINSKEVLTRLDPDDYDKVIEAVEMIRTYVAEVDGAPNNRAVNALNKHGYSTSYSCRQIDQFGPSGCTGHVAAGQWRIDLSDEATED
jgi:hypothetical protein